ncbi:MAG: preprotein translocase subunit YajC [Betaproteobacteria bacterium AqS2]|uniref:Sec translocon accessory complex subunit YajC n=1 Tax=Candidatus Amphirhobacter heronislandensis TaxID=1732024 RepID=A0A930UGD0_9GAMM|nr:preprotein translocase subunit YajC [Betaproteobacteria bacterium AqS2]
MPLFATAHAQDAAAGGGGALLQMLPLLLIIALFYFMLIRPQQRKAKQHRQMLGALEKGNEVVTAGGVLGRVVAIHDNFVTLDVGNGVQTTFQKQSIQTLLPKGTIEGI